MREGRATEHDDGLPSATGRRVRIALFWSGLRWRARSSVVMLAVASFATGAAAFGSIYLHSEDQLVLRGTLGTAPPASAGLTLVPAPAPPGGARPAVHASGSTLVRLARSAPEPGGPRRWWGRPISNESAAFLTVPATQVPTSQGSGPAPRILETLPYGPTRAFAGSLVARTGVCQHVKIVAGTCPGEGAVAVSSRTAELFGLRVGDGMKVRFAHATHASALRIGAIYDPIEPTASYWWGHDYFPFGNFEATLVALVRIDDVFTSTTTLQHAAPAPAISSMVQLPYAKGSLNVDELAGFQSALSTFKADAFRSEHVILRTGLWKLFSHASSVEHASATVIGVADLELVLLGVLVLYFAASRTAAEREPDVRLAELRGFRTRSTVAVALVEPIAVVAAAVPMGLLAAWLVAGATAPAVFGQGIGVSLTPLAVGAAVAAGVAGIAAAGFGARRSLGRGTAASIGGVPSSSRSTRWGVFGDVAVVTVAGAAFFELGVVGASGNGPAGTDPLAALAPGLLAIALGVAAARFVPSLLAATHRRTAFSARVSTAYATRTVARRREYAAQVVLGALAVALATFAVSGWVIAGRNRDLRAELGVGAPTVLAVSVQPGTTFVRAVRAADPTGRQAMAAVVERAHDGTTLAVDARRLPGVATWPADLGLRATGAARRLTAARVAPLVTVRGSSVSAVVDDLSGALQPPPQLRAQVFDTDSQLSTTVTLGALQPGTRRYASPLPAGCPGGCRLVDLSVVWLPTNPGATAAKPPRLTVRLLSLDEQTRPGTWTRVAAGVGGAGRWTTRSGAVRLSGTRGSLGVSLALNPYGSPLSFGPADVPPALPVLVTPTSNSTASGDRGPLVVGLDGETLPGHTVGVVPALPGVGPDAVLTNLVTAEHFLAAPFRSAQTEVWLGRTATPGLLSALRAHGLRVTGTAAASSAVARLGHSGLNLAYLLYLVSAVAAGLVAVGMTAFALVAGARRRQAELASLRAVGVHARALRRAVRAEQSLVLATGLLVGVIAGAVGAVVALRSVPEFVARSTGPPLELGLPAVDLALTVAAIAAGLATVVFVGSSLVVRGATVDRLAGGRE